MVKEEIVPCKRCKCLPKLVRIGDLWYAQDIGVEKKNGTTVKCTKWGQYSFLGLSRKAAIDNWNYANTKHSVDEDYLF